jgi:four helix bundle protein
MDTVKNHQDLAVWQKSVALASRVYAATRMLPSEAGPGLDRQLQRASVAIASNIAEASARRTRGEYAQFLNLARGFLLEVEAHLLVAVDQGLIARDASPTAEIAEVGRLLDGLIRNLRSSSLRAHAKACAPFRST